MASVPGKILLVTGPSGVGKRTLIMRVFESLKSSHPNLNIRGYYTREIRAGYERVGFEVVTLADRTGPLLPPSFPDTENLPAIFGGGHTYKGVSICVYESFSWPTVGKYRVDVASFESLALPELQVLDSNVPVLITIPSPKSGRDIPEVVRLKNHSGVKIFTLSRSNRNAIREQIYSQLVEFLSK